MEQEKTPGVDTGVTEGHYKRIYMTQSRRLELALETLRAQVEAHSILLKALFDASPKAVDLLAQVDVRALYQNMHTDLFVELIDRTVSSYRAK